ncbi:glutamine amidotransferase-related protein [Legionella impletisoli]|uniref:GMP synthase n=1 Tax=Legionella impletisoli TaxID=343510 RepID=A0A917N8E6_9GAMM|nr:GMP synthase [Legionella impletisoli]GGI77333.1 GMP synthase [Legionella impletisoli]
MKKIGIIQCDEVDQELKIHHGDYPEMFLALLQHETFRFNYQVYRAFQENLPKNLHECDAYLITGSRYGVNEELSWIRSLEGFIQESSRMKKKMVGICFGHQLIAKALGGKVAKSPKGWGVGTSINTITRQKTWMLPELLEINMLVSHQDQVVEIPSDFEVIASNAHCPIYMTQFYDCFLTIQGHPEFSKAYTQALIEKRKSLLAHAYEPGLKSLELEVHNSVLARWIINFLLAN